MKQLYHYKQQNHNLMMKPRGIKGKLISNRYKTLHGDFHMKNNQLFKIRWLNEKFHQGRFWKRSILNKMVKSLIKRIHIKIKE